MHIILNKKYEKLFLYWIITLITLVISMIVIGGLTRLTNSGLSITEWELFKGILPPFTEDKWIYYFNLYKEIPQYKLINNQISLEEFKVIFYWEYIHRLLGRFYGIIFLIPLLFLIYKKVFFKEYVIKFILLFLFVLFQGFIGWYMVESGLVNNTTVSHFRLSLHLFNAFIIFSSLIWIYFIFKFKVNKKFFRNKNEIIIIKFFLFLIFLQVVIGAFVSGLDAGKIYQTWPLMNHSYFPDDLDIKRLFLISNLSDGSFVQFLHRNLAYLILIIFIIIGYKIIKSKIIYLYKTYIYLSLILTFQITLGILTLLSNLNIYLAIMHQFSSIILIFFSLRLYFISIN
ncbi:MAG: COX15/CtaA family protein [Pelagibacteraceae bacterium]